MKVLIVEDEAPAAEQLIRMLNTFDRSIQVLDHLDTVKSVVAWFDNNEQPDLVFLDIQLADGLSFEIFEKTQIKCPIVFTTAYDQYALKAFQVNSIDYLLKPINEKDLTRALEKYHTQKGDQSVDMALLKTLLDVKSKKYKEQFIIKLGEHLKKVLTADVQLFYSEDRSTYLFSNETKKYILDFTLDQIEEMIDPNHFFRINRKYIVCMSGIKDMVSYSSSRLMLKMTDFESEDMIVSRERVSEFKTWLDR